jgi:hypothetical protein
LIKLFPNLNDHIRAHFGAKGARVATVLLSQTSHCKALVVQCIADNDIFFRASQDTKPAPLTPFFVEDNFWHDKKPLSIADFKFWIAESPPIGREVWYRIPPFFTIAFNKENRRIYS